MIDSNEISIIVQGPVSKGNIVDIANYIEIYRDTFSHSEIICVFSSFDIFYMNDENVELLQKYSNEYYINTSLKKIKKLCNKIILCNQAIDLPPIKTDTGRFNGNHQIEAAKRGLNASSRKYVLRIRNDAVFCSKNFVNYWSQYKSLKRGEYSIFKERLLISNAFTINPYGLERFPFHWSDWFHFGLLEDVRALWQDIPYMSAKELLFYKYNPHPNGSHEPERRFFAKRAVEQHINFTFFKKHFPNLSLNHINDCSSIEESILILRDNFVICDPYKIDFIFDKYKDNVSQRYQKKWLITQDSWKRILEKRSDNFREILSFTRNAIFLDENIPFPRTYYPTDLFTKIGQHNNNRILINKPYANGVLVYGPHVTIPLGHYKASCTFDSATLKNGTISIKATLEHGRMTLFSADFNVKDIALNGKEHELEFEFLNTFSSGHEFEIVISVSGVEDLSFYKMSISRIGNTKVHFKESSSNSFLLLSYSQLSTPLRLILSAQKPFLNKKKKRKLINHTFAFLNDSKSLINKFLLIRYIKENNCRNG